MTDPIQTLSHRSVGLPLRARVPYATYVLVGVNVAILVAMKAAGEGLEARVFARFAQDRVDVWHGEWWRLITATFIHEGWAHLALNMLLLVSAGGTVERLLGTWRFTTLYLISGLSGSLCFQAFASGAVGIGASGAILGVFGAYLLAGATVSSPSRRAALWKFLRWAVFLVLADFAYSYVMERMGGVLVASSAHAGGLVAGGLLGRLFAVGEAEPRGWGSRKAALLLLVLFLGGVGAYAFLGGQSRRPGLEGIREFERLRESGDPEAAVKAWKALPLKGMAKRELGYHLWDWLKADGRDAAAAARILDELILGASEEYDALKREKKTEPPELANELAWYLALQGTDLPRALSLADRAVRLLEGRGNRIASVCINTRGWVHFLFGETEMGLRELRTAADLSPSGPNFLYLALAHAKLGNVREAREAGQRAREEGDLSLYEDRLLQELEENVGGL